MTLPKICPICQNNLVPPIGPPDATLLLVGEFPGWKEIVVGRPFADRAGEVLYKELARVGIDMGECRVTNLWLHAPKKDELEWHLARLIEETRGRKSILLMGSDVSETLIGRKVMDVSSLMAYVPMVAPPCTFAPNPASVYQQRGDEGGSLLGEFRLAVEKFAQRVNKRT